MNKVVSYKEGNLNITDEIREYIDIVNKGEACAFVKKTPDSQTPEGVRYVLEGTDVDDEYLRRIFCHMTQIPYEIAKTQRLIIRESSLEDVSGLTKIYDSVKTENEDAEWSLTAFSDDEKEECRKMRAYIENMYGFYDFGLWTVVLKETGEVIGRVGFSFDDGAETPELGFVIGKKWQGNGYAHEAAAAAIEYMREELEINELSAKVSQKNIKSLNMLKRLDGEYGIRVIIV